MFQAKASRHDGFRDKSQRVRPYIRGREFAPDCQPVFEREVDTRRYFVPRVSVLLLWKCGRLAAQYGRYHRQ